MFNTDDGSQQVKTAPRPMHPLGKCLASTDLLAWVLTSKYADALPLYRLEGILKRHGGQISRTTMANGIVRLTPVFQPVINLLRERQMDCDYLQADETRLQVLKKTGKSAQSDKWMWVIRGGPTAWSRSPTCAMSCGISARPRPSNSSKPCCHGGAEPPVTAE